MYNETLGKIHFWLTLIFFNMIFFVQHFLGLAGMPRRIPDYPLMFETWNKISSIGAFGMGLAQLLFLYIVLQTIRSGEPAPQKPWEGADSLEWTHLPTPAPYHTFETQPVIKMSKNAKTALILGVDRARASSSASSPSTGC